MSSPPKTRPETWVPAGAEKGAVESTTRAAPPSELRKQSVTKAPPEESRSRRRIPRLRKHATNLLWALLAAAVPWAWFLVRDLGSVTQLIALAIPVLVAAAFVGMAISLLDERRLSTLIVAVSVAAFGWVTIFGPRTATPAPAPAAPVRIASMALDGTKADADAVLKSVAGLKADLLVVVEPSKRVRNAMARTDRYAFALTSGQVVVLSSASVRELPLPKPLPSDLIVRLQVDRPDGAFIVYAVRAGDSLLESTLNDPLKAQALRDAASEERLPVVLAGDFGFSDRSSEYRVFDATFRDAMRADANAQNTATTFPWSLMFVRTGFVLTSPAWCAAQTGTFDVAGAQTDGLVASVGPCHR
jgi:endonuclease/exonuclease/phosphatase family metal-dependent hydrolase